MNTLLAVFLIAALGYFIGGIRIKGVELGTAGVLLVALVFGHFGVEVPSVVRNIGLAVFVGAVGFIAGPKFFRDFKTNALSYILLGVIIIGSGAVSCVLISKIAGIRPELAVGLLNGALTSTPGLAAAQEASGELANLATTGYAIAYPFGVIGVVLFVQLIPKILKVDMAYERSHFEAAHTAKVKKYDGWLFKFDQGGFFAFMLAIVLGILLGNIHIPLSKEATFAFGKATGPSFSLGTTGGPLIMGLLFGHFAHFGHLDVTVPVEELKTFRELGLMLFLIGAGVQGGAGFIETLKEEGFMLFVYGAILTMVPMLVGFFFAKYVLKLRLLNNLGSITGGMTSTPALGTLISVAKTDDVASAYAATYPIALVLVVLASQFIVLIFA
ncbi:MAG: permease [Clostridia bacterium]|nr:permease [Clostridia bacterium]